VPAVTRIGPTSVDRRRRLLPRDYLTEPQAFGRERPVSSHVPPGGDEASALIAWLQHQLVRAWRQQGSRPSGARLGRHFDFSRQTFSRAVLGQRWMGEAVQAALIVAVSGRLESLLEHRNRGRQHAATDP
jgi:hypothetical protein